MTDSLIPPYRTWCAIPYPAKKHRHTGHMVYGDAKAKCTECGQRWELRPPDKAYNTHRFRTGAGKKRANDERRRGR